MTESIYHEHSQGVPSVVRKRMGEMLTMGLELAHKKPPVGEGCMLPLFEEEFDAGNEKERWELAACVLHDDRVFKGGPHVVVNADRWHRLQAGMGSCRTGDWGRLATKLVYTKEEELAFAKERFEGLKVRRAQLEREIHELGSEIALAEVKARHGDDAGG
jgi:hypothetical protein